MAAVYSFCGWGVGSSGSARLMWPARERHVSWITFLAGRGNSTVEIGLFEAVIRPGDLPGEINTLELVE